MNRFIGFCAGALFALTAMIGVVDGAEGRRGISTNDAIKIARTEAEKRGLVADDTTIDVDEANTEWNKYLKSSADARKKYRAMLEHKRYLAVYLGRKSAPRVLKGGGDAFVLVNLDDGMVIDVIQFK